MSSAAAVINQLTIEQRKQLSGFVDEIAKMEASKKEIADDIKAGLQAVADKLGISKTVIKRVVKERTMTAAERQAQIDLEEELDACRNALGDLKDTPLGRAAEARVGREWN